MAGKIVNLFKCYVFLYLIHTAKGSRYYCENYQKEDFYSAVIYSICKPMYQEVDRGCLDKYKSILHPMRLNSAPLTKREFIRLKREGNNVNTQSLSSAGSMLKITGKPTHFEDILLPKCFYKFIETFPQYDFHANIYVRAPEADEFYTAGGVEILMAGMYIMKQQKGHPKIDVKQLCENLTKADFIGLYRRVFGRSWNKTSLSPYDRPSDWLSYVSKTVCKSGKCHGCLKTLLEFHFDGSEISLDRYKTFVECSKKMSEEFSKFIEEEKNLTFSKYIPTTCKLELSNKYPDFDFNEDLRSASLKLPLVFSQQFARMGAMTILFYYNITTNLSELVKNATCLVAVDKFVVDLTELYPDSFNKSMIIKPPDMPTVAKEYCRIQKKHDPLLPQKVISEILMDSVCHLQVCKDFIASLFSATQGSCLEILSEEKVKMKTYDPLIFSVESKITLARNMKNFTYELLPENCTGKIQMKFPDFNISQKLYRNFSYEYGEYLLDLTILRSFVLITSFLENQDTEYVEKMGDFCERYVLKEVETLLFINPADFNRTEKQSPQDEGYPSILETLDLRKEDLLDLTRETIRFTGCLNRKCASCYSNVLKHIKSLREEIPARFFYDYFQCVYEDSEDFTYFTEDKSVSYQTHLPPFCLTSLKTEFPNFNFSKPLLELVPNCSVIYIQTVLIHESFFLLNATDEINKDIFLYDDYCQIARSLVDALSVVAPETFLPSKGISLRKIYNDTYGQMVDFICSNNEECKCFFNKVTARTLKQVTKMDEESYYAHQILLTTMFNQEFTNFVDVHKDMPLRLDETFHRDSSHEVKRLNKYLLPHASTTSSCGADHYHRNLELARFEYCMVGFYLQQSKLSSNESITFVHKLQSEEFFLHLPLFMDEIIMSPYNGYTRSIRKNKF